MTVIIAHLDKLGYFGAYHLMKILPSFSCPKCVTLTWYFFPIDFHRGCGMLNREAGSEEPEASAISSVTGHRYYPY